MSRRSDRNALAARISGPSERQAAKPARLTRTRRSGNGGRAAGGWMGVHDALQLSHSSAELRCASAPARTLCGAPRHMGTCTRTLSLVDQFPVAPLTPPPPPASSPSPSCSSLSSSVMHVPILSRRRREDESSFMLMTKCCHDIDLIRHIVGKSCQRVASFGSVSHFRRDKKPPGAGMRCLSCSVEPTCPFSAKRLYLDPCREGHRGWPISGITDGEPTPPDVEEALSSGPYGRCVYECDNDVCDQQVVSMEFDGGVTATLTTAAFTHKVCQRHTRVFGTRGELEGDGDSELVWFDFATRARKVIHTGTAPATTRMTGHGGADYHLADAFVQALRQRDPTRVLSGPDETLESHLIVFAAEAARRSGQVLSVPTALKHGLHGAVAEARGGDPSSHASIVERVGPELHQALRRLERGPDDSPMAPLGMALPPSTTAPISAAATLPPRIEAALGGVLTPSTKVHVTAMPAHTLPAAAAAAGAGAGSPLRSPAPYASPALTPLGRPSFAERGRSANTPHRQLTAPPSPPPLASNLSDLDDDDDDMVEDEDDARQGGKAAAANQSSSSSSSSSSSAAAAAAATGAARG